MRTRLNALVQFGLDHAPDFLVQPAVSWKGRELARSRFDSGFLGALESAKRASTLSVDEIRTEQVCRLRHVLRLASEASPYYRRVFESAGLELGDIATLGGLEGVPLLRRDDVAESAAAMLVRGPTADDVLHGTSGSTGHRLRFWLPAELRYRKNAAHLYAFYDWFGFGPGMPRVTLGGRYLGRRASGRVVHNASENQLVLGAHGLSERSVRRYCAAIWRFRPVAAQGHPSVIGSLVDIATLGGLELPPVPLVFTTGEELSFERRAAIEHGFAANHVVDMYGNGENTVMASECPARCGLHVDELFSYVELIPHPTGLFEIVSTSLLNDLMPYIRYATGDLTRGWVEGECACGRTWRRLDGVIGRVDDTITFADGRVILPVELRTAIAQSVRNTPAYKVLVAGDAQSAEVILYDDGASSPTLTQAMLHAVERLLGPGVRVRVRQTSRAEELTTGGKRRLIEVVRSPDKAS